MMKRMLAGVLLLASACHADRMNEPPGTGGGTPVLPFIVSNAMTTPPGVRATAREAGAPWLAGNSAFVSLPPGMIAIGESATIRNERTGATVTIPMRNGGFDPVAIPAETGDSLGIAIARPQGLSPLHFAVIVAPSRPPVIVRTNPPPQKRDIPLNAVIVLVFSEPIDPATVSSTTVRLTTGGADVSGTRAFLDAARTALSFVPSQPLLAGTDYTLLVTRGIHDLAGDALDSASAITFTTAAAGQPPLPAGPFLVSRPLVVDTIERAFISAPPGSFPGALQAHFTNKRTGAENFYAPSSSFHDGALDPIAVPALAGDTIAVEIFFPLLPGAPVRFETIVPAASVPRLLRTSPAHQQAGVVRYANIEMVFSEPMDAGTLIDTLPPFGPTNVQLWRGSEATMGTLSQRTLGRGTGTYFTFIPATGLALGASYSLVVTGAARGRSGTPLASGVTVMFTVENPPGGPLDATLASASFSMIEYRYGSGSQWYYAPQLRVVETGARSTAHVVHLRFIIPGLPGLIPPLCASGTPVAAGQQRDLFVEGYGDYEVTISGGEGVRATGADATVVLTYRDDAGRLDSLVATGPVVPGTLPTTYSGGEDHGYYSPFGGGCTR